MLQAIEVIIEPGGAIRCLEELHVATPTRAILTLLPQNDALSSCSPGHAEGILQFLKENPLPPEYQKTAAEIDARIQEEREVWD